MTNLLGDDNYCSGHFPSSTENNKDISKHNNEWG